MMTTRFPIKAISSPLPRFKNLPSATDFISKSLNSYSQKYIPFLISKIALLGVVGCQIERPKPTLPTTTLPASEQPQVNSSEVHDDKTAKGTEFSVQGTVLGADGQPLANGVVVISDLLDSDKRIEKTLLADGKLESFSVRPGFYRIRVYGINHQSVEFKGMIERDLYISGHLAAKQYDPNMILPQLEIRWVTSDSRAIGSKKIIEADTAQGHKITFRLPPPPNNAAYLRYQWHRSFEREHGPTPLDNIESYDPQWISDDGHYWAQIPVDSNLSQLAFASTHATPRMTQATIQLEGLTKYPTEQIQKRFDKIIDESWASIDPALKEENAEHEKKVEALTQHSRNVRTAVEKIDSLTERAGVAVMFFALAGIIPRTVPFSFIDAIEPHHVDWVPPLVPPDHPAWVFDRAFFVGLQLMFPQFPEEAEKLYNKFAQSKSYDLKTDTLILNARWALLSGNREQALMALRSVEERDPTGSETWNLKIFVDPRIQVGKKMPKWSFAGMDKPNSTVSSDDYVGKPYLLDFWATWCRPCVAEIPNLQKSYGAVNLQIPESKLTKMRIQKLRRHANPKIEFISVSFDVDAETAKGVKKQVGKMPWTQLILPNTEAQDQLRFAWDFQAIPIAILVDETGTIVATKEDLMGEKLLKTLKTF